MALINVETAIAQSVAILKRCDVQTGVEILSYKRNRFVTLIRLEDDLIEVTENGYEQQQLQVNFAELSKNLKAICKREFPRSRKLRLFRLEDAAQVVRSRQKI